MDEEGRARPHVDDVHALNQLKQHRQEYGTAHGADAPGVGAGVPLRLNVGIVGGGLAGLMAGIALVDAGHHVEIFEKSRFNNETGAAVGVHANCSRILRRWGFDTKRARGNQLASTQIVSSKDPTTQISFTDLDETTVKYGAPFMGYHRVDMHNELKRLVTDRGATVKLKSEVDGVDPEKGIIYLKNMEKIGKDLVVGADGLHSITTNIVTYDTQKAHHTGQSIYRALIPTEKLEKAGLLKAMKLDGERTGGVLAVDPVRLMIWYPCRDGEIINLAALHPTRESRIGTEDWYCSATREEFLDEYKDFNPDLLEPVKLTDDIKHWPLLFREPIDNWFNGKLVLCGDAAHPMLPHRGQGAAQAAEDAVALGLVLSNLTSEDEIPRRLALYQQIRKNRAATTQIFSNANQVGQDQNKELEEQVKKFYDGPWPQTQADYFEFNWGYDVFEDSLKVLKENGISVDAPR